MTQKTKTIIGFGDDYIWMHNEKLTYLLEEGVKIIHKDTQVFPDKRKMISSVIYEE